MKKQILLLFLLFFSLSPLYSDEKASISLITVYPGKAIYSAFGHSAFRITDGRKKRDLLYNFGTFDFSDPSFIAKFVQGQLNYYLDIEKFKWAYKFYSEYEDRTMIEQTLNMNEEEIKSISDFLEKNAEPENKYYKYDFIKDNCSSRIRTVLDSALGGKIQYSSEVIQRIHKTSYRSFIRSYLSGHPWFDLGIELALGRITDRPVSEEESFFLPLLVMDILDKSRAEDGRNLVSKTEVIYKSSSPEKPAPRILTPPFILFSALLIFEAALFIFNNKKIKKSGKGFELLAVIVNFLFGLLLFYLWFISDHSATKENFDILWCSPLNIIFIISFFLKNKTFFKIFCGFQAAMCIFFFIILAAGIEKSCPQMIPLILIYFALFLRNSLPEQIKKSAAVISDRSRDENKSRS